MKDMILAIKGHATRGNKVIKILEMLGGNNKFFLDGAKELFYYYIGLDNNIYTGDDLTNIIIFSLEEFLEKYPFKVGDKCKYIGHVYFYRQQKFVTLSNMCYVNNTIEYRIDKGVWVKSEDLQHYKEEIKAEDRLETYTDPAIDNDSKTAIDIFVSNESLGLKNGYIANKVEIKDCGILLKCVKNKPQYPKTYVECSQIINKVAKTTNELNMAYNPNLIYDFQKLLICRDAYWKFEGDWKPIWNTNSQIKYLITRWNDNIIKETYFTKDCILAFPTEEMRDAFYENFKDLIESCKEFL